MGRKLIKQGGGGYTIYLPKKWVDERGLQPGAEIDVQETDKGLLLSSGTKPRLKEAVLDIDFKEKVFLDYVLATHYRAGYDRLILRGNVTSKDVELPLRNLVGMEVSSAGKGEIVLEIFAEPFQDNTDKLLKQIFFIVKEDLAHVVEELEKKGKPDLKQINHNSMRVMRNSNLCIRAMSKKLIAVEGFYWLVAEQLHWIERQLYYLAAVLDKEKTASLSAGHIAYMKSVQKSFDDLYDGIYRKSLTSLKRVYTEFMKYESEKYVLLKSKDMCAVKVMSHFTTIYRFMLYTASSAIGAVAKE